ncbi:MAG: AMP-dependent synthetase/ligase, partial [Myxococcota bacterium]|nr:AMP-dependent synthetase/ligase [Myxococcota bacterium]
YSQLHQEVSSFAAQLKDQFKVKKGDRVTLYMPLIPELTVAVLACARLGAIHSVVFGGFSEASLKDRILDAQSTLLITADGGYRRGDIIPLKSIADKALSEQDTPIKQVIVINHVGNKTEQHMIPDRDHWYHDIMSSAPKHCEPEVMDSEDDLFILYTSGTTGKPKGVVLTHANMMYECTSLAAIDGMIETNDVQLLFLPLAHVFAKVLECYWFTCGHKMAIDSDITQIVPNMSVVRPTVMCSVPRIFEKVYAKVAGAGTSAPGLAGKLFSWTLRLNERKALLENEGRQGDWWFQLQLNIAKSIIFSKIEKKLTALFGGRLRFFISGGAPLSKKMAHFFHHAGITILEGYGLTETSAATTVNRLDLNKLGTVGKPLEGTEVKIAEDGEILIRGPGVMREYWNREAATREVLIGEGWFASGDIGIIDDDGYLRITDRKKDIIVTAGGKNVAPQNIEGSLKAASPLISQVLVYGDKRKYLTALVTIDPDNVIDFAQVAGIDGEYAELCAEEAVRKEVERIFASVNNELAQYETIKKFEVLDKDFTIGDELTPTMKLKRKHATKKYESILSSMYDEPAAV